MAVADPFGGVLHTLADPPLGAFVVTPSDTVDLPYPIRAFETVSAGDVACICADGSTITFTSRAAGQRTSCCITRILAAGTAAKTTVAAGNIIGLR